MGVPFTADQFLGVFEQYNLAVWPMQIFLYLIALIALILILWKAKNSDKIISGILAFFWLWMGIVYHLIYFTSINNAAYIFGALFIVQSILFFISGFIKSDLSFKFNFNAYTIAGAIFILYGLIIYPILGYSFGHVYPRAPTFGVPCPTIIFTFGVLLWTNKKFPKYLLIIPLIWSFLGFSAVLNWGILEDIMLLIAGVLGTALIVYRDRKS
ncbi:MAG: DUF6064 family protein [Candidatus Methanoperedens sp.]|nr:DUF6064 family protein [Candidatus Methanoperedens sp.]MCZ7370011.1 DUF6064 family protein [Candidatus Methanoperedens sp.]